MLATGLAALMVSVLPTVSAQAESAPCAPWTPTTGEHFTSNHLLSVYLQMSNCMGTENRWFKVVIHNYSTNGVGSRAYGLAECDAPGDFTHFTRYHNLFTGVFIPANGVWASDQVLLTTYASGVIFRPRTSPDAAFEREVATGCV